MGRQNLRAFLLSKRIQDTKQSERGSDSITSWNQEQVRLVCSYYHTMALISNSKLAISIIVFIM